MTVRQEQALEELSDPCGNTHNLSTVESGGSQSRSFKAILSQSEFRGSLGYLFSRPPSQENQKRGRDGERDREKMLLPLGSPTVPRTILDTLDQRLLND